MPSVCLASHVLQPLRAPHIALGRGADPWGGLHRHCRRRGRQEPSPCRLLRAGRASGAELPSPRQSRFHRCTPREAGPGSHSPSGNQSRGCPHTPWLLASYHPLRVSNLAVVGLGCVVGRMQAPAAEGPSTQSHACNHPSVGNYVLCVRSGPHRIEECDSRTWLPPRAALLGEPRPLSGAQKSAYNNTIQ